MFEIRRKDPAELPQPGSDLQSRSPVLRQIAHQVLVVVTVVIPTLGRVLGDLVEAPNNLQLVHILIAAVGSNFIILGGAT